MSDVSVTGFPVHIAEEDSRVSRGSIGPWTAAAGAGLGIAYAASPLSVWFVVVAIGLFAWAGRGLSPRERRWVWGLMTVAVALRLLAVIGLALTSDPYHITSFFWDGDGVYVKQRALWIRNVWLGVPVTADYFGRAFATYGWTSYLYVIAYIQYWLGPAPYAIHLLNITLFLASTIALFRVVRSAYGRPAALLGLAILLLLPTPFLWSVTVLKESLYVLLLVLILISTLTILRGRFLARVLALAVLAGSIAAIDGVRFGALTIAASGLGVGLALAVISRRLWLVATVLVLLPFAAGYAWNTPDTQAQVMEGIRAAARQHIGHVRTNGHSYRLLDQNIYSGTNWYSGFIGPQIDKMTPGEAGRFVLRAFVSFFAVPLPWQMQSKSEMVYFPQQVVWYVLVVLAPVGLVAGFRRDALFTSLLVGHAIAGTVAVALTSGNIGTMVRHRDTVVPFILWLSALGAVAVLSSVVSRCSPRDVTSPSETEQR